jgi:opacity protein-like surface antigen
MKKHLRYLALSTALLISVSANAAVSSQFGGFYLGANVGYGFGSGQLKNTANAAAGGTVDTADVGLRGVSGGLQFGYNHLFTPMFLAGLELSADLSGLKGDVDRQVGPAPIISFIFNGKRKHAVGAAVRLGAVLHQNVLGYFKIGVDFAKWNSTFKTTDLANFGTKSSDSKNEFLAGLVLGLGFETFVSKHVVLGLDWAYKNYKRSSTMLLIGGAGGANRLETTFKPQVNDFRVRLSYKF